MTFDCQICCIVFRKISFYILIFLLFEAWKLGQSFKKVLKSLISVHNGLFNGFTGNLFNPLVGLFRMHIVQPF